MHKSRTLLFIGSLAIAAPLACGSDETSSPGAGGGSGQAGSTANAGGDAGHAGENVRGGAAGRGPAGSAGDDAAGGQAGGEGGAGAGEPSFLPLYASGSRLRAISVGEKGSKVRQLVAFFDEELELECTFRIAEDGEYRCLPLAKGLARGFADADCSEPILYDTRAMPCRTRQPYLLQIPEDSSCTGTRVIALEPRSLDTVFDEGCGDPLELADGALVFEEGDVVPPARFVRAERARSLNSAGFGVDELRGEDGSRQVTSIAEEEYGACWAREVEGGGLRCVPNRAYLDSDWYFADSDCERTPLAYAVRNDDCPVSDPVRIALELQPGVDALARVLAVEPAVSGKVYERSANACTERDTDDLLWTLHPIGGEFDVERLLALEPATAGTGRARLPHYAHRGTLLALESGGANTQRFFDAELDVRCNTLWTADGEIVCLPDGVANSTGRSLAYTDSDCTEPVLPVENWPAEYFAPTSLDYCARSDYAQVLDGDIYAVGDQDSGPLYTLDGGEGCRPAGDGVYITLTAAEPDFMTMVEEVE